MSWTVKGHDWAVEMLQQHIAQGKLRHAYLFTGPPGVGRRTLALQFAQAINCAAEPRQPGLPCGECRTCRQIGRMQQSDLALILPEADSLSIKVEQIRELQHTLNLSPYESRYRVAILTDFQSATTGAQNAFLKTLEEAPEKVVLLLTADLAENLLPTIVSRCEILRLRPSRLEVIQHILQADYGLAEAQAQKIAHLSGGKLGTAIRYHADKDALEQIDQILDETLHIFRLNLRERFKIAERFKPQRYDREESIRLKKLARLTLQSWLLFWRDIFFTQIEAQVPRVYVELQGKMDALEKLVTAQEAQAQISALEKALHRLETTNVNTQLLVEVLLLDWPRG